jgi:hypothetical protein
MERRAILAVGVARCDWRRHGRMVDRDSVGRYRPLSMAFGLEDLFDRIIATASELRFKHGHTCVLVTVDRLDSLCSRHGV